MTDSMNQAPELPGLYDDDRSIRIEQSINGEFAIIIGNQTPIFVYAEDIRRLVNRETEARAGQFAVAANQVLAVVSDSGMSATNPVAARMIRDILGEFR